MPQKITHEEALEALKDSYLKAIQHGSSKFLPITQEDIKDAMKSAFKEMLDEKATQFGYLSLKWIATFIGGGLILLFGLKYGFK